jgi:hypothetical protein
MRKIIFSPILVCSLLANCCSPYSTNYSIMINPDPVIEPFEPMQFPQITVATLNCNSLNMSSVTKHTLIRKFYGIVSLKTDIILLSDLRMCNKAGLTDSKFIFETFGINPHCSYNFYHHSPSNSRGVGILVKKSLKFSCLETERDPVSSNFLLLRAEINDQTVIIGSIYGPNNRDDNFFVNLSGSLRRLGRYPIIIGGDGTPTKRQVSKRQVSKRLVSKRLKRQVFKTSGLQNVMFTKRQVFKTSGCKMSGFKTSFLVNISKRSFSKKYIDLTYVMSFHKVCY